MKYLKRGRTIISILFAAALLLCLPCVQCAYASAALPADDDPANMNTTLSNVANAVGNEQQTAAIATNGRLYIILMVVLAVLALGFIVFFNIQRAAR